MTRIIIGKIVFLSLLITLLKPNILATIISIIKYIRAPIMYSVIFFALMVNSKLRSNTKMRSINRLMSPSVGASVTKLEFGLDERGELVLGDEAFTPDSSRFWPADEYRPGETPPSYDKQFVRDYCESLGWNKTAPGPELPDAVVTGTRARYVEAFERLTGISFDDYVADPSVVLR